MDITFRAVTIYDRDGTGLKFKFTPGIGGEAKVENRAVLGTGYWVKPAGFDKAVHTLELWWSTATPETTRLIILGLKTVDVGDLVIPGWGTYTNCMLADVAPFVNEKSQSGLYRLETTLTFDQYP